MEKLFFELLQVALDVRPQLDAAPSAQEWAKMMRMAREQALVGVCFAGVKKLERSGMYSGRYPFSVPVIPVHF